MEKRLDRIISILENIFQLLLVKLTNEQAPDKSINMINMIDVGFDLNEQLLSAQEVMTLLKIGPSTYYRFVKKGILHPIIVSKRHYYRKSHIKELLTQAKFKYK
ncbi:helix-turn-helix domain-containing protein [Sphingobacterium sp. HJSM2_6]|uniref:helix-turn-helix domain-containing protein n=1 Tax=Sphingobacterium sp. HJSM2_6 TaxID=3366264 RepID=UPI003BCEB440